MPDDPHRPRRGVERPRPAFGNGIVLAGVREAVVERNLVLENRYHGIVLVPNIDRNLWLTADNVVRGNVVRGSGRADLTFSAPSAGGDCWQGNDVGRAVPWALQRSASCSGTRVPRLSVGPTFTFARHLASRPEIDVEERAAAQPEPELQEQMPGGVDAAVRPAHDVFAAYDVGPGAIGVPDWDGTSTGEREVLYLIAGRPRLPWTRRLALVGGGLVGWIVLFVVSVLTAGVL